MSHGPNSLYELPKKKPFFTSTIEHICEFLTVLHLRATDRAMNARDKMWNIN